MSYLKQFLHDQVHTGWNQDQEMAWYIMSKLCADAKATCDWCGGILHGHNSGKCGAEARIRATARATPATAELLKQYLQSRTTARYNGALPGDIGAA